MSKIGDIDNPNSAYSGNASLGSSSANRFGENTTSQTPEQLIYSHASALIGRYFPNFVPNRPVSVRYVDIPDIDGRHIRGDNGEETILLTRQTPKNNVGDLSTTIHEAFHVGHRERVAVWRNEPQTLSRLVVEGSALWAQRYILQQEESKSLDANLRSQFAQTVQRIDSLLKVGSTMQDFKESGPAKDKERKEYIDEMARMNNKSPEEVAAILEQYRQYSLGFYLIDGLVKKKSKDSDLSTVFGLDGDNRIILGINLLACFTIKEGSETFERVLKGEEDLPIITK